LYWNPEQPPPSTLTRSMAPAGSAWRMAPIRRAARSLIVTFVVIRASEPRLRNPLPDGTWGRSDIARLFER